MINCTTAVKTVAMKLIRKLTLMLTLTFWSVIYVSDKKCRHFRQKHLDVLIEITEIQEALPLKFKTSSIAETSGAECSSTELDLVILDIIHSAINCDHVSYL